MVAALSVTSDLTRGHPPGVIEQLAEFESVGHALETARGRDVQPVMPRIVVEEDAAQIILPGEPGYAD